LLDALGLHAVLDRRDAEAARFFDEALALWSDDPTALLSTGRLALRANDAPKAIERLTRCATGSASFECRMELARAYVVGPRDLAEARRELLAAREMVKDPRKLAEVDQRLNAVDAMTR
jgi:hypothetical protein